MKCIVPIQNLVIEEIIELDDAILVPAHVYQYTEIYRDFYEEEASLVSKVFDILNNCTLGYKSQFTDFVTAIIDYPVTKEQFENTVPLKDFYLLERICTKVDRCLDKIRLKKCYFGNKELLPGIAGVIGNYQRGFVIDMNSNLMRDMLGHVYKTFSIPGIGLDFDSYDLDNDEKFDTLFMTDRTDEVFLSCRSAIARINEAYYFNNYNAAFVYLMSTLEMLASDEYMQFKKVKTNIAAFIASNKSDYHKTCELLRNISEDIRTEIVHNGKSIYDLVSSEQELIKLFGFIVDTITTYCENVIDTGITNFNDLKEARKTKIESF
ncbi:conserved hypothetical protein [Alkaliphilus metalliredigens QYMF]|uniref:Apea-like HEPN domain-containing protein n=1 Tax=Alkaliphilus metalliredigens (strain QYMF) TaxID=293826 RepID=A6TN38_ALKMQ|nr:hypothetical protein [Alkaliphilus metalliredigens]ABR47606.1 conserved hypothetical protein [Alkaliphilus metalliredigens QYMF]